MDGNELQEVMKETRCGSSIWTTFRFASKLLFALCWIIALPVELVLNRRMGRRYTGFLPMLLSLMLMGAFLRFGPIAAHSATKPNPLAAQTPLSSMLTLGFMTLVLLSLLRHRIASWWRFRRRFECWQIEFANFRTADGCWMAALATFAEYWRRPTVGGGNFDFQKFDTQAIPTSRDFFNTRLLWRTLFAFARMARHAASPAFERDAIRLCMSEGNAE